MPTERVEAPGQLQERIVPQEVILHTIAQHQDQEITDLGHLPGQQRLEHLPIVIREEALAAEGVITLGVVAALEVVELTEVRAIAVLEAAEPREVRVAEALEVAAVREVREAVHVVVEASEVLVAEALDLLEADDLVEGDLVEEDVINQFLSHKS